MTQDDIAQYNKERWEALAQANVEFSRPALDLDPGSAREMVDPYGIMGEVHGRDVLCLAGGGGQQSAAFGLLGANVTVLDLSETQLQRDREAAAHYGLSLRIEQGDMRDLSRFRARSFDVVWHAHSITFVPDAQEVFGQIKGPREFRHTLSTLVNGLASLGFVILGLWEERSDDPDAEPGTWEHFKSIAPPYLTFWAAYRPNVFAEIGFPK